MTERTQRSRAFAQALGFTLLEMVITLLVVSIISAVILPNLDNFFSPSADAARETVLGALRRAKSLAYSHRRLVCVTVSGSSLTMVQASANPAVTCTGSAVSGPDGNANFLSATSGVSVASSPSSALYFQPGGTLTSDVAGSTQANYVLTVTSGTQPSTSVTINGASASPE